MMRTITQAEFDEMQRPIDEVFEEAVQTGKHHGRLNHQTVVTERLTRAINRLIETLEKSR